jgi:heme a synthase
MSDTSLKTRVNLKVGVWQTKAIAANNVDLKPVSASFTQDAARDQNAPGANLFGDEPGRFVRSIRGFANAETQQFRKWVLWLLVVIGLGQGGTAALKSASRDIRAVASGVLSFASGIAFIGLAVLLLGRYVRIGVSRYRFIARISAALLTFIIFTGAAVRLTGSGLGCPDWPTCKEGKIIPSSGRAAGIEFGNRMVTGLCVIAAAIGVLTALIRRPYRRDLVQLGLLVSVLIFGNAIVGGLSVRYGLNPYFVMSHFLLAIASLAAGLQIFHRAAEPGGSGHLLGLDRRPAINQATLWVSRLLVFGALSSIVLGTIVTGSGPHGGDPEKGVVRFGFVMETVAQIHSGAVIITLAVICALAFMVWKGTTQAQVELRKRLAVLLSITLIQGTIGYVQWFNQVPALLVQFHVIGASFFWICVLWVRAAVTVPVAAKESASPSGVVPSGRRETNPVLNTQR